jgi:hypothetical protein
MWSLGDKTPSFMRLYSGEVTHVATKTLVASPPTWLSRRTQQARLREIRSEVGTSAHVNAR